MTSSTGKMLDFTCQDASLVECPLRLRTGIPAGGCKPGEEVILEPQQEEVDLEREQEEWTETYYSKNVENLDNLRLHSSQEEFDPCEDWSELKQRMAPLTGDRGVLKWNQISGPTQRSVPSKSSVTCFYELMVEGQDEPFDSSFIRGVPERFKMDCGQMIQGLEILLRSMHVGDTAVATLAPEYAYGQLGVPPRIPKNCEVMVCVKLINVTVEGEGEAILGLEAEARLGKPLTEIVKAAESEQETGNNYFKMEEVSLSVQHYSFAIRLLEERRKHDQFAALCKQLLVKLYLNKALCYIIQGANFAENAKAQCKKALELDTKNVKGHFRLGKAYFLLGEYKEARESFKIAAELLPKDTLIEQEIRSLDAAMQEQRKQETKYCLNMFKQYDMVPERLEKEVLDCRFYSFLKKFKEEADTKEIILEYKFFVKDIDLMKKAARYLDLNFRLTSILGKEEPKIVITRKSN